jgi:hypothetical protein
MAPQSLAWNVLSGEHPDSGESGYSKPINTDCLAWGFEKCSSMNLDPGVGTGK